MTAVLDADPSGVVLLTPADHGIRDGDRFSDFQKMPKIGWARPLVRPEPARPRDSAVAGNFHGRGHLPAGDDYVAIATGGYTGAPNYTVALRSDGSLVAWGDLASCNGGVPDGSPIDTSSVGNHSFTAGAVDNAGNMASLTHTYDVVYTFAGFLAPIDNEPTVNNAKAGQTVPVSWRLTDVNGGPLHPGTFAGNTATKTVTAGVPKSQVKK